MLLPKKDDDKRQLAVIDFGLGSFDRKEETKVVDLYVLELSLQQHIRIRKRFSTVLRCVCKEKYIGKP